MKRREFMKSGAGAFAIAATGRAIGAGAPSNRVRVAIMGCQVNGPGEAKGADIAVTGIGNKVYLYVDGEIYREIDAASAKEELLKAVSGYGK